MRKRTWTWLAGVAAAAWLAAPAWAAEGHGSETNIFNADIGNFIFTLLIFGLVILVLGKFAWRPVLSVLQERERTIRESLSAAKQEREQAAKLLQDYEAQLARARAEATALIDEGRRDAEAVRQRLLDQTRQESAALTERARREIQLATDTALKTLYDHTADVSLQIAGRVLQRELSAADHRRLIDEALAAIKTGGRAKLN